MSWQLAFLPTSIIVHDSPAGTVIKCMGGLKKISLLFHTSLAPLAPRHTRRLGSRGTVAVVLWLRLIRIFDRAGVSGSQGSDMCPCDQL